MKTFKNLLTIIGGITVIAGVKAIYEKKKELWYLKGKVAAANEMCDIINDVFDKCSSEVTDKEPEEKENEEES